MDNLILPDGKLMPISDLPENLQKKIQQYAALDIYKDRAKEVIEANQVDINEIVIQWLAIRKSSKTQEAYKKALDDFFIFLKSLNINPLLVKPGLTDKYMMQLTGRLKPNTIRQKMSACSSFYSLLKRYSFISVNPFHGAALPRKEYRKAIQTDLTKTIPVMNKEEYEIILEEIENRIKTFGKRSCDKRIRVGAKKLKIAIHFMAEYGLRAGAIQTIIIQDDRFSFLTKGNKSYNRILEDESKNLIMNFPNKQPFKTYGKKTMQSALKTITSFLYESRLIRYSYSCHDFRHFYAVNFYEKEKDIVRLKALLGHASINVTDVYLQSLGIKGETF